MRPADPAAEAAPARSLCPRAREVLLAGGHAATLARQADYLDAVEKFLDRPAVEGAVP